MKKITSIILFLLSIVTYCQNNDGFTKRLKAINSKTKTYYNVDGVDFSSETFSYDFSEKSLKKLYRKFSIKEEDLKIKDDSLNFNNFHITKSVKLTENLNAINSFYFVEDKNKTITIFWFGFYNKNDEVFERKYINRILNKEIPQEVFESITIDSIDFAGRAIILSNSCYWTNVNTIQCPYNGEMNWSIHKTIESAQQSIQNQFTSTKYQKGGKIINEEDVDILFEGTETKAKRIIYDFTGVKSLLAGVSGGKTLTIYYVASKVRENYVSCCLSFWNNDVKTESGLAPLLNKVMQIKN
ncbi:hypothetical protein [Flavobacterium hercynium]|uniref:Uncharacterized protein n=1 Tax=Flavobacterium hercynium TaxID=387094 RepID=A0A226HJT8_9FLAO|nr:hypothetical protein [Flavobacterium hercynium]OXA94384.1 hypothetical protein B0A66_04825 [Flavobacterium hercynium]SMP29496.1 hypothetical protein SAMN06265346_11254 [Flavobacterium hercynium]